MLGELMALLMRPELTPEEKAEELAFKDGHVHGMKPGMPAPPKKEKLHWVKCRFEEDSADYLPQVLLDTSAADGAGGRAGAGAGRKAEAVAVPAGYVAVSLLCSHDFNVASQMPAGMFMTSREECESGRHAWYQKYLVSLLQERGTDEFKWRAGRLCLMPDDPASPCRYLLA